MALILEATLPICGVCGAGCTSPASRRWPGTAVRQLFMGDPQFQLESRLPRRTGALVLDEVQCVPEVFAALRGLIDRDRRRHGRFVLLGSAQPTLIRQVSESLAGRVGILELDPLTVAEAAR